MKNETHASAQNLLLHEHKKINRLFEQYDKTTESIAKEDVVQDLAMELHLHMMLEEKVFFPAMEKEGKAKKLLSEALKENDGIKVLIDQLQRLMADQDEKEYSEKMCELRKCVEQHIENTEQEILAKAESAGIDMEQLGDELAQCRDELTGKVISEESAPGPRHEIQPEHTDGSR